MNREVVEAMSKKVPAEFLETVTKGKRGALTYIPIDKVIRMLNERFGDSWSISDTEVTPFPNMTGFYAKVNLVIIGKEGAIQRPGVGADIHRGEGGPDPDKMIKTALANAVKKAANMFGMGLELWDKDNTPESSMPAEGTQDTPQKAQRAPQNEERGESSTQPQEAPRKSHIRGDLKQSSKDMARSFMKETGLNKAELEDILKEMHPESGGNPGFLVRESEEEENSVMDAFLNRVRKDLAGG